MGKQGRDTIQKQMGTEFYFFPLEEVALLMPHLLPNPGRSPEIDKQFTYRSTQISLMSLLQ